MTKEVKLVGGIIAAVVLVLGVGVFLMTRSPENYTNSTPSLDPKTKEEALNRETPNIRGKKDSNITVIEFGDIQCPACAAANPAVDQLFKDYGDKVKFIFRHNPLPQHANALAGADAVEAAGDQGKFWEMVDAVYARQPEWETASDPKPIFRKIAADLGLDAEKFDKALSGQVHRDRINQDKTDGIALGNPGTPTFYVNGEQVFQGGVAELRNKIDAALKDSK
jgi:protein-disulfide isomerase